MTSGLLERRPESARPIMVGDSSSKAGRNCPTWSWQLINFNRYLSGGRFMNHPISVAGIVVFPIIIGQPTSSALLFSFSKIHKIPPGALRGCRVEPPPRLGGAQRGDRRAPKGGPAPLAEVPHQRGMLARNNWCGTSAPSPYSSLGPKASARGTEGW